MANIRNLYIDQGSDYTATVVIKTSTGIPLNLTTYTVKAQIRKSYGSSFSYNFDTEIIGPYTEGRIRITLPASTSDLMQPGRWLYDIEITQSPSGDKTRVLEGLIILSPQITQT